MTTTNGVTGGNRNAAALAAANASTANMMSDTQNQFLSMLVTQLQNQDPLNPMDNAEVTSQIAQLSTVNGITQRSEGHTSELQSLMRTSTAVLYLKKTTHT